MCTCVKHWLTLTISDNLLLMTHSIMVLWKAITVLEELLLFRNTCYGVAVASVYKSSQLMGYDHAHPIGSMYGNLYELIWQLLAFQRLRRSQQVEPRHQTRSAHMLFVAAAHILTYINPILSIYDTQT